MRSWLMLDRAAGLESAAMLALRIYVGAFLVWGVWDNIVSAERMAEFAAFLAALGCPAPALAAPASVWAQLIIGLLIIPGLLSRWSGLLLAANFAVAVALLGLAGADGRGLFPPAILIFVGALLATRGAGALSADAWLARGR